MPLRGKRFARFLERMAERTMADIMKKGCKKSHFRPFFFKLAFDPLELNFAFDELH